jgi:glycosyltransferase involved in cell wall biosynthesis
MVPAWPGQQSCADLERLAAAGKRPRTDYVELARALDADVMDMQYMNDRSGMVSKAIARVAGMVPAQVAEGFLRRNAYEHVVARADRLGLPLALLHKIARSPSSLSLISVWLSRPKKALFLRPLRAHSHLKAIINYGSVQMRIAAERLGVPHHKLHHVPQPVDDRFWRPTGEPIENTICSIGAEARDYPTLIEAVTGLDVRVRIAVGTTVFHTGDLARDLAPTLGTIGAAELPANVQVDRQLDHRALRSLYSRSRFVVVPLRDVEFDAGVTSIAEAMAMGKAVVVTRARGQADLVREGETGLYVPPGDAHALRAALEHLLTHPQEAERLGEAGRSVAMSELSLDRWVRRVADIIRGGRS